MGKASDVWSAAKSIGPALASGARVLFAPATIEIVTEDDRRLALRSASLFVVFNRAARSVKAGRLPVASFESFSAVEVVRHFVGESDQPIWSVFLRSGAGSRVLLGTCVEPTQASVVGAHVSTFTGLPVKAIAE
jgi:hypothetical protein